MSMWELVFSSKVPFQESGVVILRNDNDAGLDHEDDDEGVDEVESDSDSGLGGSVPPCSVIFIGANVSIGKSSMRSKPRDKKVRYFSPLYYSACPSAFFS